MALGLALLTLTAVVPARGQQLVVDGAFDVAAGIEGGASGYAAGVRRTRTTLRFGADGWVDEYPHHIFSPGLLVEIEPVAAVGADLRYTPRINDYFRFHIGPAAIIAPNHMIGATFGMAFTLGLSERIMLNFAPIGNVYFVGADLPGNTVLWQAMAQVGVRVRLW